MHEITVTWLGKENQKIGDGVDALELKPGRQMIQRKLMLVHKQELAPLLHTGILCPASLTDKQIEVRQKMVVKRICRKEKAAKNKT